MSGQGLRLPDCSRYRGTRALSTRQRRELIQVLAQEGPEGLEAWIEQEAQRDPEIRARIEEERARLERQARRQRRRIQAEHESEREQVESRYQRERRELREREAALRERMASLEGKARDPGELARRSTLLEAALTHEPEEKSLWQRLTQGLYRAWLWLLSLWVRLIAWITGKDPRGQAPEIELPEGTRLDLPRLLADRPGLRVKVRERIRQEESMADRLKRWWQRLTGREDYSQLAAELMREELEAAQATVERERQATEAELEEQLESLEEREQTTEEATEQALDELDRDREEALSQVEERIRLQPLEGIGRELLEELEEAGLVDEEGTPTERLMQRFSDLLYQETRRALPHGGRSTPGHFLGGQGEYEKGPMRSLNERGFMDLGASVVNARTRHPDVRHIYDEDVLVHREVRASDTHVVLVFDRSGSMEEKGRFEAAKRVCLVMYKTVKDTDPDHRVDILSMSTGVERVNLADAWTAEMGGFTNHGAALREARRLLEHEDADRKLVYLITDGLPEAYTREDGVDVVDAPEVCMAYATEQARKLKELSGARLMVLQLETEEEMYLEAAREIAEAGGGEVVGLEPEQLAAHLVLDFEESAGGLEAV